MDNGNYLDHTFVVSSFDIDMWGYMKPTAILNISQEVAYMHSSINGHGFDTLMSLNMAWVLSRAKVIIDRLPRWHEQISVRTWHKRQSGLFALRDYIFYDSDNQPIIHVTTSWLIINIETRRISRVDRVFNHDGASALAGYAVDAIAVEAERVELPADRSAVGEHRVVYSDLDLNRHVNNAKYMEWACDYSHLQMQPELSLRSFCINFNHEATYDEVVTISNSLRGDESIVIEGAIDQCNIFAVAMEYRAR